MTRVFNLATGTREEREKVNTDLAAAVAWKERMNQPVLPGYEEQAQAEHLREYFAERLAGSSARLRYPRKLIRRS